jgi:hypothetical protein
MARNTLEYDFLQHDTERYLLGAIPTSPVAMTWRCQELARAQRCILASFCFTFTDR